MDAEGRIIEIVEDDMGEGFKEPLNWLEAKLLHEQEFERENKLKTMKQWRKEHRKKKK